MAKLIDKVFSPLVLIFLNLAIILGALTIDNGIFFAESGLIHFIALGFILFASLRIFWHYYIFDQFLEKFLHTTLLALSILSIPHIIEFFWIIIFQKPHHQILPYIINFYAITIITIIFGVENFLRLHDQRKPYLLFILLLEIVGLLFLSLLTLTGKIQLSFETTDPIPYLFSGLIFLNVIFGSFKIYRLQNLISIIKPFSNYLCGGFYLIAFAAGINIFFRFFQSTLNIEEHYLDYLSHFPIYIALSLLFLAFAQILKLGGIYKDLIQRS